MPKRKDGTYTGNPVLRFRIDGDDLAIIDKCAKLKGISRSEYARDAVVNQARKDIKKGK